MNSMRIVTAIARGGLKGMCVGALWCAFLVAFGAVAHAAWAFARVGWEIVP